MEQEAVVLRDIHSLDAVPWWPLAPGWWYLLALVVGLLLVLAFRQWLIYNGPWMGWRGDARRQLRALKKALPKDDPREVASRLSELLRRIAMARSGRREAAGLTGDVWLHWLVEHDTSGFDWVERGRVLLVAPYMPPASAVERAELQALIRAATRWLDTPGPEAARKPALLQRLKQRLAGIRGRGRSVRV
jgi:hypothetical protein